MTELIERLEAASEGSRELDREIQAAIDTPRMGCPYYTTSLDAALTPVPEGWSWRVGNLPSGRGFADLGTQPSLQCVEGSTPALALCIATLKARAGKGE